MKTPSIKNYMFRGIFFILTILLLIFTVFGIFTVSQYVEKYQKEMDLQTDSRMRKLNYDVDNMYAYISSLFSTNVHFDIMKRENTNDAEWMKAAYYLNNSMEVRSDVQDYFAGTFFYGTSRDMMFSHFSSIPLDVNEYRLNEALKQKIQTEITGELRYQGTFEYENKVFLIRAMGNRKTFLGYVICLSDYFQLPEGMELLGLNEEGEELFSVGTDVIRNFDKLRKDNSRIPMRYIYSEGMLPDENICLLFIEDNSDLVLWKNKLFILLFLGIPLLCIISVRRLYKLFIQTLYQPIDHVMHRLENLKNNGQETGTEEEKNKSQNSLAEVNVINERLDKLLHEIRELELEKYRKEGEANAARLQYYQLQVRPHFYLNCLTILDSLLQDNNTDTVRQMIYLMSDHIRYSFRDSSNPVSLGEELEEVRAYVNLYMIRQAMPIFLQIFVNEEDKKMEIPILSIQPFVENSIKYAHKEGKILAIEIKTEHIVVEEEKYLKISVSDNGEGFPAEKLESLNQKVTEFQYHSRQVGVDNLKYRLHLLYGEKAHLFMYNKPSGGAMTEILIPEVKNEHISD